MKPGVLRLLSTPVTATSVTFDPPCTKFAVWTKIHLRGALFPPQVTRLECADNFVVKYWQRLDPNKYEITPLVPVDKFSIEIDVVPKVVYQFQVKREMLDKAPVWHLACSSKGVNRVQRKACRCLPQVK